MLNIRDELHNWIDMRGTLALDSNRRLGVILSKTKLEGRRRMEAGADWQIYHAYVGLALDYSFWECEAPTTTAGTVRQWKESGQELKLWLARHGAVVNLPDNAGANLTAIAEEAGLL